MRCKGTSGQHTEAFRNQITLRFAHRGSRHATDD